MKIAYIAAAQIPSTRANSIQVMKVCQAFKQNGHEPRLYVPGRTQHTWAELSHLYGVQEEFDLRWLHTWQPARYLDFSIPAVNMAIKWEADLIYTRMLQVARVGAFYGYPVILEMHDLPSGNHGPTHFKRFIHEPTRKLLVFITRALRNLVEEQMDEKIPDEIVHIAPDGVDLERYADLPAASEARANLGMPQRFTALYSGSFYQGRGMQMLFELAKHFTEMQFLWVGGSPEEVETWRVRLADARIENVTLPGFVDNALLPTYQAAADILLMPYSTSIAGSSGGNIAGVTSPMKLFEYMACGRPILTSDLPVLHEVLNDQNAVFCPPDDLGAWKTSLQNLVNDAILRERLGSQALKDVVQYSWRYRMQNIIVAWKMTEKRKRHE